MKDRGAEQAPMPAIIPSLENSPLHIYKQTTLLHTLRNYRINAFDKRSISAILKSTLFDTRDNNLFWKARNVCDLNSRSNMVL